MRRRKRWIRIALNLKRAVELAYFHAQDTVAIFDSDIIIPGLDKIRTDGFVLTPCYWLWYDWAGEVRPFCSGTNFIMPRRTLDVLRAWLTLYTPDNGPIDLYLHDHLPHINVLINGTVHYVKTPQGVKKLTMTVNDLPAIRQHIPEFVLVVP